MRSLELTSNVHTLVFLFIITLMIIVMTSVRVTESRKLDPNNSDDDDRPSITTYDQRQTGKYNVHVNIKDVKIISVDGDKFDGEFGDDTIYDYGDYDYDPAHLTVNPLPIFGGPTSSKPPKSTTKAPVSTTTITTTTTRRTTTIEPTKNPVISDPPKTTTTKPIKHDDSTQILSVHSTHVPSASNIYIFKPTPNYHPKPVHYDYQEIPVEVIVEPVLKPKYRSANTHITANRRHHHHTKASSTDQLAGSAVHYVHVENEARPKAAARYESSTPLEGKACAKGEYRNRAGKCRERRSGILRLFNLLAAFKKKDD